MSAGPSQAAKDIMGASNVDSCEGSQFVSYIQQREPLSTDRDALWKTIKSELFACVGLLGVISGSRQQTETGSKGQEIHRLRRGEQSLPADGSRDKTSGANNKRDVQ